MLSIAVLITCHNRKSKTLQCLKNLFEQVGINSDFNIEVFLVDDASTDGTGHAVKEAFPDVNIILGNGNLYWNRGMHKAWTVAVSKKDFDYYLWLNDDTFLFDEAIKNLLEATDLTQDNAVICGCTFSTELQKISYGGNSEDGKLLLPNGLLQESYTFNGNVVLIPQFVYHKVGILDARFPHSIGDYEYALRIRKNNFKSFITKKYIGNCEGSDKLPDWCSPSLPLIKRIKSLYSPLGNSHPYYFFLFESRYHGYAIAVKHLLSIHMRLLFPQLWKAKIN
ncbi:glycosyl transferase family 2 [Pedobacter glucosidilyticus]|nr:glycosyltransferase [Pedobacter glucosidilyticus]KHJ38168.1 glycosyl transferase family 2 [Pedobacter glucosidilyticus]